MPDFIIKQLPYDLSQHAGLALIGKYLKRINLNAMVDPVCPVRSGIANSDILKGCSEKPTIKRAPRPMALLLVRLDST